MKQKSTIAWIVAGIVIVAAIFLFVNRQKVAKEKEVYETQNVELQKQFNGLMADHEKIKAENQDYAMMLQEKDSIIYVNAETIKKLMAQASTSDNYRALKRRYDQLEKDLSAYKSEIDLLRQENERLIEENEQMREVVLEERTLKNQLQEENDELSEMVELAKVLKARNIEVTPMRVKSCSDKLVLTKFASKLKQIHVEMEIDENRIAEPGMRTMYLRVQAPNNKVIMNVQGDEYTFRAADGNGLEYTAKQNVEFSGNARNAKIIWNKNDNIDLGKGFYRVSIYCDGYEIGRTRFEMK